MNTQITLWSCFSLLLVSVPAFAQKPELVAQTGHAEAVWSIAFSPDGTTVASGSGDKTIKLWDMATGRQLRTLSGHASGVKSVAFGADGKTLASGSRDKTIKLWEVATGRELRTLRGHSSGVNAIAFSADGKMLASGSGLIEDTVKLWEVATGRELRTLSGHSHGVDAVAFSADGQTLASGSADKTIKLWEVATGRELRTLSGHYTGVNSVTFSADGKTLASGGSFDETIKVWEVATGRELRTLSGHSSGVTFMFANSVAFSADGMMVAVGSHDGTIKLWELDTERESRTLTGPSSSVRTLAFSADGKTLASDSSDGAIRLWEVATGRELPKLSGRHSTGVNSVAFSADGKTLASGGTFDETIKVWGVAAGRELRTLSMDSSGVNSVAFSADGRTLASGNGIAYSRIKLWEVATGRELRTLSGGRSSAVNSVAFSADGKTLASGGSEDNTIKLWNSVTGRELSPLSQHSYRVSSVAFSADGKTLASGSLDRTIKLWDVATGRELRTLSGERSSGVRSVAFSPDGKALASGSEDKTIRLWNVATGRELLTLRGHSSEVNSVAFRFDGKTLASASEDNTIKLWETATGREMRTLSGHSSGVRSVAFSAAGEFLFSGSADASIKLWSVETGDLLASLIALDETDWLVITPEGLFDGSPAAWKQLMWRFDNDTFKLAPVEAYFNDFYYPGLLQEIIQGKRPVPPAGKDLTKTDRRRPTVKIALSQLPAQPDDPLTTRTVTVLLEVADNSEKSPDASKPVRSGAQDVRLFRNDSLVKVWRGDVLKGQESVTLEASVPIVAGANEFTAYAFNHENVKSEDATIVVTGADSLKRKGTAYILAVGVNIYANAQYNLKYAAPDAQDFGAELKQQQEELQTYERVEVIALVDKEATKGKILQALTDLQGRTQPQDAVVVYFAGHGTAHQNRFYLIPHDLGYAGEREALNQAGLEVILSHSISDRELEQAFERVDAGHILLVIDACNSGQALEAEEKRRGPMNSKGLAQLAYEKGMYVMTAAQSYQEARASSKLGHGYLTYALVEEGLKSVAADTEPKDGQVLLREWLNYATDRVPLMQAKRIKEERRLLVQGKATAKEGVQDPRVFYPRERKAQSLIIARTATVQPRTQRKLTVP